jgi:phage tail sheath protein FI
MPRLDYFAPGVYIEEIDRGSRPIEGVSTNVGGFIGFTEAIRGGAEPFKPMLITTWDQYLQYFAREGSDGFISFENGSTKLYGYLPFAVQGWFLNGGGRCYVMSIGTELPSATPPATENTALTLKNSINRPSLEFAFKDAPENTGRLFISIEPGEPASIPDDPDIPPPIAAEFFTVRISRGEDDPRPQKYEHLTMHRDVRAEVGSYIGTALAESELVTVTDLTQGGLPLSRRPVNGTFELAPPLPIVSPNQFFGKVQGVRDDQTGVQGSFEIDDINILAFPDLMLAYQARKPDGSRLLDQDQIHGIMELMVSLCENAAPNPANRMVVLDTPPDRIKPQQVAQWLSDFGRRSMYAALYYPWIKVANPKNEGKPILVPPCGHMMGIWSRTDETRGVYKAPANETPRGVIGLAYDCNFREQELLNPIGINCIRTFPNRGIKVWGARTLVEPEKTEWRYISVRRLMSYINKSIELGTQWVVFEPNDEDLWARVRRTVSNFLERLWREGALFGGSPEQAFYVKCDGELNRPETMILGRLYVEVGVCPVRPAEFVIFRISQWTSDESA